MYLASGQATERKPGRKFGAEIQAQRTVASVMVGGHATARDQMSDTIVAGGLASDKRMRGFSAGRHSRGIRKTQIGLQWLGEAGDGVFEGGGYPERCGLRRD